MGGASAALAAARAGWDAQVLAGHLLRRVDAVLDLTGLRERLRPRYSRIGRPSVDPAVLLRMLLVGYLYGITSERRLAEEVRYNVAYRWFVGLGPVDRVPHHSTFSKARHGRFRGTGVFRALFEDVVRRCVAAGLIAGDACSVDGSFSEADAGAARRLVDPGRAEAHVGAGGRLLSAVRSPADPDATWASKGGPARFAYYTNYLLDNARGVIVDVEATPALYSTESVAACTMVARTRATFGLTITALGADRAYGDGAFLAWCAGHGVTAYVPVLDRRGQKPGGFTQADFTYDPAREEYVCPAGARLWRVASVAASQVHQYRAPPDPCPKCALRAHCTTAPRRQLSVSWHDVTRRAVGALAGTPEFTRAAWARKKVEARVAELKRFVGLRRLRLRRLPQAAEQFLLAATVQNLKRLAATAPP